ncbi:peptide MFS transporter, partial [Campylobacter jejuni]|nr:peptide ABC transporter [Campylobacter jejuni]EAJ5834507.1 peptide MFS transporter [Campylobacter jejuni]
MVIYFIYLFVFKALNKREKQQLTILIVLFFAATFFWSAFEQKPTAYNLFAQDFTNR